MAPTSDTRCEVAEELRDLVSEHSAVQCDAVAHVLGLKYEVHGCIAAFNREDVTALADLIDPTCKVSSVEPVVDEVGLTVGWEFHLTCGHTAEMQWNKAPVYCPECGARCLPETS